MHRAGNQRDKLLGRSARKRTRIGAKLRKPHQGIERVTIVSGAWLRGTRAFKSKG